MKLSQDRIAQNSEYPSQDIINENVDEANKFTWDPYAPFFSSTIIPWS